MTIEHKFIDLKALKVSDEGSGFIEGYRSVFGEIDEGGDIIVKGAFADSASEYMHSGFSAHSHEWNFNEAVGFPVDAREDEHGWFVKSQFHTTQNAQDVRTIARERMAAGKQVGFSFGYKTDEFQIIEQKDFKDQLPQFIKPERLAVNLKKAQQFSRIRILKKVSAIEDSLVTAPMNKLAAATGVKSVSKTENKGLFEDAIADCEESLYFLTDKLITATYRAQMIDEYAEDYGGTSFDLAAAVDEMLLEFSARYRAAVLGSDQEEDTGTPETPSMASWRGPVGFKGDLRDRLPFAKHAETALGAVEVFARRSVALAEIVTELTERSKSIMELREAKAGAVYSSSNLSHMTRIHDAIGKVKKDVSAMHGDMAALIAKAKKKDKKADDEPELDMAALRARGREARERAMTALYT